MTISGTYLDSVEFSLAIVGLMVVMGLFMYFFKDKK